MLREIGYVFRNAVSRSDGHSVLIPGFIWKKVLQISSPYVRGRKIELLECLTLSCFNYLLALLPIGFLLAFWPTDLDLGKPHTAAEHPFYLFWWLTLVFILPAAAGYTNAKLLKAQGLRTFLGRFGVSLLHPAPTAWDYVFARDERYWARVELVDGSLVEGVFDSASLASSVREERDIFLQTVYELDDATQQYQALARNVGVWIRATEIRRITFFEVYNDDFEDTPRAVEDA